MPLPYAEFVAPHDPIDLLRSSLTEYRTVCARLTPTQWAQPIAPGKWTVRQVIVHVAQWELIWGVRLRCAVGSPDYVIQPIEQDDLMSEADVVDGPLAFAMFDALREMHIVWLQSLTAAQREQRARHATLGEVRVEDAIVTMTGHAIHHVRQLQQL